MYLTRRRESVLPSRSENPSAATSFATRELSEGQNPHVIRDRSRLRVRLSSPDSCDKVRRTGLVKDRSGIAIARVRGLGKAFFAKEARGLSPCELAILPKALQILPPTTGILRKPGSILLSTSNTLASIAKIDISARVGELNTRSNNRNGAIGASDSHTESRYHCREG